MSMYHFGRCLQLTGLAAVPLAVVFELVHAVTLRQSLVISAFGILLFTLGYYVSSLSKRP